MLSLISVASVNNVTDPTHVIAKIDSGATHNYIKKDHQYLLTNATALKMVQ